MQSKNLSKYVTTFNYIDKILVFLNTTAGGVSIISHATVVGAPAGITSDVFFIVFSLVTGIIKRNKKKQQETKRKT